jgi:thiosulfate/3-mercaptopyruvate sulfurtransferase
MRHGLAVSLAFLLAASAAAAPYANPGLLIETDELAGLLGAPGVRIVDLRGDGEAAYQLGHIPGAIYLASQEMEDPRAKTEGYPIRPDKAVALFGGLGIDQDTTVIAYDDVGSQLAARLFFVLEYYGHTRTRVLNGGLTKWRREGRPLSRAVPAIEAKRFEPRTRREVLATAAEVKADLGKPEVCLIDARSPEEYAGQDVRARRGGHIPGATNVEWTRTLNPDQTFKSADALRAIFEAAGVRPDRQVVTYCQSGWRAAHDYFALRLLGYVRIKNYDGSWHEWGNDPDSPVAR